VSHCLILVPVLGLRTITVRDSAARPGKDAQPCL